MMISIEYQNNKIKLSIGYLPSFIPTPLKLKIKSPISNKIVWESNKLNSNNWAMFPNVEIFDALVFDANDNLIFQKSWNVYEHGTSLYQQLYYYLKYLNKKGKNPKGVAIGTHNGEFGEWVPSVIDNLTDALLVEASKKQFKELEKNYKKFSNVKVLNSLITGDGSDQVFWEGGRGYTNSIVKRVPDAQETEPLTSTILRSININEIVNKDTDWLHLDTEGYDYTLLMSLEYLPKFIIFEYENLLEEELQQLKNYLIRKQYIIDNTNAVSWAAYKK